MSADIRIAYFVSPHGFGHATRASAVITALQQLDASIQVEVLTTVPKWLFDLSIPGSFSYHPFVTDIGLAQESPFQEDVNETKRLLESFLPFDGSTITKLVRHLTSWQCDLIVCDIAPLGIVVGKTAGIPSVLVENFTWDRIYHAYCELEPAFAVHVSYLETVFAGADYHIRAEPGCDRGPCDLSVLPIGRRARTPASKVRENLGIENDEKMVLVTLGGTPGEWRLEGELCNYPDVRFVAPANCKPSDRGRAAAVVSANPESYHPDLVRASDVVIGKVGYSTVAEVYHAGIPFGFVPRTSFGESAVLERFVGENMHALAISAGDFEAGTWASPLSRLLGYPKVDRDGGDGAVEAARYILSILG